MINTAEAVTFHLENMTEYGDPVPMPRALDQLRAEPEFIEDFRDAVAVALVPYVATGKVVRINITIDKHLLAAIDRAARASGSTRSGLMAEAARRKSLGP